MIYVIGDSHTWCFRDNSKYAVKHLGARTAYQIERRHKLVMSKIEDIPVGSTMIWTLGEIDCRIHILMQHHKLQCSVKKLVTKTANRFLTYISKFNGKYDVRVMNIVPVGVQGNIYNYPFYGTQDELTVVFELYNAELKRQCKMLSIPFLDIYDQLIGNDGYRKPELVSDDVHLNNTVSEMIFNKYFKE